jgi:hypothetical protein
LSIVLDSLRLLSLILAGSLYFLGLGWLIIGPILHGSLIVQDRKDPFFNEFPLIFLSGLILNFALALLLRNLNQGLIINGLLAVIGLLFLIIPPLSARNARPSSKKIIWQWITAVLLLVCFIPPILAIPTANGDARTMWFFFGKMMFYAGTVGPEAGWTHPSVVISHVDYPIFVPMLAAQVMHIFGFWNEYLPRISVLFIYIPAIFWLMSFSKKTFSFVLLALLIPFRFFPWIWDGHMDGLLAIYFAISLLVLSRFIESDNKLDLLFSIACIGASLSIKNEGALAFIAWACAILYLFMKFGWKRRFTKKDNWNYVIFGLFVTFPYILWQVYLKIWHVQNDLQIGNQVPQWFDFPNIEFITGMDRCVRDHVRNSPNIPANQEISQNCSDCPGFDFNFGIFFWNNHHISVDPLRFILASRTLNFSDRPAN